LARDAVLNEVHSVYDPPPCFVGTAFLTPPTLPPFAAAHFAGQFSMHLPKIRGFLAAQTALQ
jgi:hypothetical protein